VTTRSSGHITTALDPRGASRIVASDGELDGATETTAAVAGASCRPTALAR